MFKQLNLIDKMLRIKTFLPTQFENFVFGQQHLGTEPFFTDRFGQAHTIFLRNFPHYQLLEKLDNQPDNNSPYIEYLKASWDYLIGPENNTKALRMNKVNEFIQLYEAIKGHRKITDPIILCKRPDGNYIIVTGNHRAAIALKLRIPLKAMVIKSSEFLNHVSINEGEYFGTGRLDMPYQSIYLGSEELVPGRRPDIYERLNKVDLSDIQNRTILDLGCNIGAHCFLVTNFGATKAIGVDNSDKLVSAAIRINAFFAAPCDFIVHDLNTILRAVRPVDTVFCFSVTNHLETNKGLVMTLRSLTKSVLYFEGHSNTDIDDYPMILNQENFSKIEFIGYNRDSIDQENYSRPFFRCEV
jgi:hypothetical protein